MASLAGAAAACLCLLHATLAQAASIAWVNPSAMSVQRVSDLSSSQRTPNFLSNLDCISLNYTAATGSAQTGCFTGTPLGMIDSDSDTLLSISNDRGFGLVPYTTQEALVPWPNSSVLIALDAASTGGSYISLYRNPLLVVQNHRDASGKLVAKQLIKPPEISLKDPAGKQLVINPQTLAFSDNGSWMVVETLSGAFVRVNLTTLDMVAFAPAFGSQGSPGLLKSQVTINSAGDYVAIANKDAASLKVYDLTTCVAGAAGLQLQTCAAHEYQPFVAGQIAGLQAVKHLRFINEGLLSFDAQTSVPSSSGVYELAPAATIKSLINYLALGDSYTSGEGAFDYIAGTDTADNRCHLSADAYPLLLSRDLFSEAGGHSVACSGAEINDVSSTGSSYRGQVRGVADLAQLQQGQAAFLSSIMAGYYPGYVAQQRFVQQYQPAITTVSVGGNDIGFGDILQKCVTPHISLHQGANTCYSSYEDRLEVTNLIDRTVPRWAALYKQLVSEAPGTVLYVIGYPQITYPPGNCAINVHFNKSELEFATDLTDYLNAAIQRAADTAGARYVDISQALAGHRLCEAASYDVAVNGLTAGTDAGPLGIHIFGQESYHPTALGQALMEQAILHQTNNFAGTPLTPTGATIQNLLDMPKTGRTVNTLVPDDNLAPGTALAGQALQLQASGARDGLAANTTYLIRLDGPAGPVAGSTTSNEYGDISGNFALPDNTAPGGHTLDLTGSNQDSEPVDVTQPVYVSSGGNDSDGDGIPDTADSCPGAVNSGLDRDQDSIDDACDGFIGPLAGSGDNNHPISVTVHLTNNSIQVGAVLSPSAALKRRTKYFASGLIGIKIG